MTEKVGHLALIMSPGLAMAIPPIPLPSPVWEEFGWKHDLCREKVKEGLLIIVNRVIWDERNKLDKYLRHQDPGRIFRTCKI